MHGICRLYDFKLFKAYRFLTIFFCRYFELYIYGTLFIGMRAMHNENFSEAIKLTTFLVIG